MARLELEPQPEHAAREQPLGTLLLVRVRARAWVWARG